MLRPHRAPAALVALWLGACSGAESAADLADAGLGTDGAASAMDAGPGLDAGGLDAGGRDAGERPADPASASFLLDDDAAAKDLWPAHPRVGCVLDLARAEGAEGLVDRGLAAPAAAAIVRLRGGGLPDLDRLDAIPFVGPRAFAALSAAVQDRPECGCAGASCGEDPRPGQRAELLDLLTYLRDRQGNWFELDVDAPALEARVDAILARGAGTPTAFLYALRAVMLALPNGHAGVYGAPGRFPFASQSPWGVCARPHARGFVVTHAAPGNVLGLAAGDLVRAVDDRGGEDLVAYLLAQPAFSTMPASASGRTHLAGQMLFSTLRAGARLTVEAPAGGTREVFVDRRPTTAGGAFCRDPFARDVALDVYVTTRPDGVVVLRLPNLVPAGEPAPMTQAEFLPYMQVLVDRLRAALDPVRDDATGVVWDLRANAGGISPVGFAVVQGFLSTRVGDLSSCQARQPGTQDFTPGGGVYEITPGGAVRFDGLVLDVGDAFEVAAPTAVLVDGLSLSAADYFALATRRQTDAWLVGAPTAGGYGSSTLRRAVGEWDVYSDALRCVDAAGQPLEGWGVEVDLAVDYAPEDLAAGRDTVLEAAVAEILACGNRDCAPPD